MFRQSGLLMSFKTTLLKRNVCRKHSNRANFCQSHRPLQINRRLMTGTLMAFSSPETVGDNFQTIFVLEAALPIK